MFSKEAVQKAQKALQKMIDHREKFGISKGDSSSKSYQLKMVDYLSMKPTDEFPFGNGGKFFVWSDKGRHFIGAKVTRRTVDRAKQISQKQAIDLVKGGNVVNVKEFC